jgi:metal-responsive CopG/Arc/MetJ family transcriptional regulator
MRIAISVPDSVFWAAEHIAKQLGMSRSQLYSEALKAYLRDHSADEITKRLDAIYSTRCSRLDPALEALSMEALRREKS